MSIKKEIECPKKDGTKIKGKKCQKCDFYNTKEWYIKGKSCDFFCTYNMSDYERDLMTEKKKKK